MRTNREPEASDSPNGSASSAGRPRSDEAHKAILDATLALLADVGFSALKVEGVASRAGVGKATIYRRWRSKLPLVVEAFSLLPALEEVDTGDLVSDLKKMLRNYFELFNSTPLGTVLAEPRRRAPPQPGALEAARSGAARAAPPARARARTRRRARRAAARSRLDLAVDLIVGPIAVRLFFSGGKLGSRLDRLDRRPRALGAARRS